MNNSQPLSDLGIILNFISSLLWPTVTLIILLTFRTQLINLLTRLSSFKVGDTELAFQAPATDSKATTHMTKPDAGDKAPSGFLADSAVRNAVRESGLLTKADEIYRTMQIFSTPSQTTWLIFSKEKVFCLLDDESTRRSGRLIQWCLPKESAKPIKARQHKMTVGLLDIGPRTNWLYSVNLFPESDFLKREVEKAINELK